MSKVFISYRRNDSGQWAEMLYHHIGMRFGKDLVFMDKESIELGDDFLLEIQEHLESDTVFLILIGPKWLDDEGRRKLKDHGSILATEITHALSSKGIVIPVLLGGAKMPKVQDLPKALKPLVQKQGLHIRDDTFVNDTMVLLERISKVILPTTVTLDEAQQKVNQMQLQYFDILEQNPADALELVQKTQEFLNVVMPRYFLDPILKVTRGYLFKNEYMALYRLERYDEAVTALEKGEVIFRTMIRENGNDASAWNGLGSIEALRGNFRTAIEYIDTALKIEPDYIFAKEDRAMVLRGMQNGSGD